MNSQNEKREKIIAVGYTRVSTDRQVDGISKEVQDEKIKEYAKQNGYELEKIYWDGGFSAKNANRPDLQQMLNDIDTGKTKAKVIIVYNLSRLSRDLMSFASNIAPILAKRGIMLRSTAEPVGETPEGKLMQNMALVWHQYDNDVKSKTVSDNMCAIAQAGYWQSQEPLGFVRKHLPTGSRNKDGKMRYRTVLEPDQRNNTAQKMKDLLDLYATGTKTPTEIATHAAKIGLRSRNGKPLSCKTMARLLAHPAMAGYNCSPLTDGEYIKAQWDGLISLEQHLAIKALLAGKHTNDQREATKTRKYIRNNPDYPLKGTLRCAHCGALVRASAPKNGSGKPSPRYHCPKCDKSGSMQTEIMHKKVNGLLRRSTPKPSLLRALELAINRAMGYTAQKAEREIQEHKVKLEQIESERKNALRKRMRGECTQKEYDAYINLLDEDATEAQQKIEQAEQLQTLSEKKVKALVGYMHNPAHIWNIASLEIRQMLQNMIFPDGIEVNLAKGKFGTVKLSPLFSVITPKNDPEESNFDHLVGGEGIEPSLSCENQILSLARLPIPPLAQLVNPNRLYHKKSKIPRVLCYN